MKKLRMLLRTWREKRHSTKVQKILSFIHEGEFSASDISRGTKMWSGTLYPLLFELEAEGILTSDWTWASESGYSRKRVYRLATKPSGGKQYI